MNDNESQKLGKNEGFSRVVRLMLQERVSLIRELARIDRFLKQEGIDPQSVATGVDDQWTATGKPRNDMTKLQVMELVLEQAEKPLTPRDLLIEMKRAGYSFASANPANTLTPLLYGKKRKPGFLHKTATGFIHISRKAEFENPASDSTSASEVPTTGE